MSRYIFLLITNTYYNDFNTTPHYNVTLYKRKPIKHFILSLFIALIMINIGLAATSTDLDKKPDILPPPINKYLLNASILLGFERQTKGEVNRHFGQLEKDMTALVRRDEDILIQNQHTPDHKHTHTDYGEIVTTTNELDNATDGINDPDIIVVSGVISRTVTENATSSTPPAWELGNNQVLSGNTHRFTVDGKNHKVTILRTSTGIKYASTTATPGTLELKAADGITAGHLLGVSTSSSSGVYANYNHIQDITLKVADPSTSATITNTYGYLDSVTNKYSFGTVQIDRIKANGINYFNIEDSNSGIVKITHSSIDFQGLSIPSTYGAITLESIDNANLTAYISYNDISNVGDNNTVAHIYSKGDLGDLNGEIKHNTFKTRIK